ncbi:MAG: hypothetical protein GY734_07640 [Herbaspirillum sp.]|jgi:hypothetical protein|uniref:hypothetical protein n=1 Tax=Herbaspirillum sp. TaxID=1890675 RepID=UPI00258E9AAF|nr:hypothetical protein [Herbaspirillum sp.]MCP3656831.1 hypothetical protein [Herbaspirillum sp.]MCP3950565.1 hypothetical protein [Herbaspirillum sp.]MCP4031100.1 hypothetical protein [Herbaspirillum sp.]
MRVIFKVLIWVRLMMSILSNLLEATKVVHARHSKIAAYVSALVAIPILVACAHTHPGVAHCTILPQSSHCVEVPVEEEVVAAQARTLNSAPVGKVAIYVLRPYAQQRNTVSQVFVDDRLAATLGPMTFFRIVAEQGTHRIRIETTGVANREYEISGDATTYLQYQLSETFTTVRGEITEQTEAQARARVARLDLVKSAGALP